MEPILQRVVFKPPSVLDYGRDAQTLLQLFGDIFALFRREPYRDHEVFHLVGVGWPEFIQRRRRRDSDER